MSATTASPPPTALAIHADGIPQELKSLAQWVAWRWEWRAGRDGEPGKWTKPPISPVTGKYASATDAGTWASFDDAIAFARSRRLPGVGLAVTREDGYVGTDIDKCRDPETGEITAWAQAIIDRFDLTYVEPSPSGTGVRMFIRTDTGLLPNGEDGRRKGPVEIYGAGRYFTVTGHRLNGTGEITERTDELAAFCAELWPATTQEPATFRVGSTSLSDDEIIDRARSATNGAQVHAACSPATPASTGETTAPQTLPCWASSRSGRRTLTSLTASFAVRVSIARSGTGRITGERTIGKALDRWRGLHARPQRRYAAGGSVCRRRVIRSGATSPLASPPHALCSILRPFTDSLAMSSARLHPHTEADDVAVLDSFLLMFGNAMGRTPYVRVGATRHHANEYAVLVGDTSHTRKGTSLPRSAPTHGGCRCRLGSAHDGWPQQWRGPNSRGARCDDQDRERWHGSPG